MDAQGFEAIPPPAMARAAEAAGKVKAGRGALDTFVLGVLAGAFIGLGAIFSLTTMAGAAAGTLPFGVVRLLGGVAFSVGLVLVVIAGAELFTGNNLLVMAWAAREVTTARVLRNWAIVYAGNLVGSLGTAWLAFEGGQYELGKGAVGAQALQTAVTKSGYGFGQAIALGILCNALVCLAVWLCYSARTTGDKILAIVPPITAFVAAGFEHSIANMTFFPYALLIKTDDAFMATAPAMAVKNTSSVTIQSFLVDNLLPVTIGNIIGGGLLVGGVYWLVYLRTERHG